MEVSAVENEDADEQILYKRLAKLSQTSLIPRTFLSQKWRAHPANARNRPPKLKFSG